MTDAPASRVDVAMVLEAARHNGRIHREFPDAFGLTKAAHVETAAGHLVFERKVGGITVARKGVSPRSEHVDLDPMEALIEVDRGYVQRLAAACVEYYADPEKWSRFFTAEYAAKTLADWTQIAQVANADDSKDQH